MLSPEAQARRRAQAHEYYLRNREAMLAKEAARRAQNPAERKAKARAYYARHRDEIRAAARMDGPARARRLERNMRYYRQNKSAIQDRHRRRYYEGEEPGWLTGWVSTERRRGAPPDAEAIAYAKILRLDPCSYCSGPGGCIDHIVPVRAGGQTVVENLTAACRSCNRSKGNKTLMTFLTWRIGPHRRRSRFRAARAGWSPA